MFPANVSAGERTLARLELREQLIADTAVNACALGRAYRQLGRIDDSERRYAVALARLHEQIAADDCEAALLTESRIYESFVKQTETEDNYQRRFADWVTAMRELGTRSRAAEPDAALAATSTGRVAFVLSHGQVLGHTEALLNILRNCPRQTLLDLRPAIYLMTGEASPALNEKLRGLPVEIVLIAYESSRADLEWKDRFALLRDRMAADGVGCCVWVATPVWVAFAFAMRLAPVQAYWTLKFHQDLGPDVDVCITYGSPAEPPEKTFAGRAWHVAPVPLALDARPATAAEIAAVRKGFPVRHLFGTLAREEKIFVPEFLDAVAAILRAHPDAGFAWTGRHRHPGIQSHFEHAGVAERCYFVGWVDTNLYAQMLDIFLETFPFGCGITGYQALAVSKPLLSYAAPETLFGMRYWPAFAGAPLPPHDPARSQVLYARDASEYVALAGQLLADPAFRDETARRGKEFIEQERAAGSGYAQRFFDICLHAMRARGVA